MTGRAETFYKVIELAQTGRLDEAAAILDRLLAENPDDADANTMRATLLMAAHKAAEALPLFARAAPAKQGDPAFHYNFARALVACERYDDAEPHARAALAPAPGEGDRALLLAACLRPRGLEKEAEAVLAPAVAAGGGSAVLLNELGLCLAEQNRTDEAAALFRRAAEASPQTSPFWHNLGNALLDQHQADAAIAAYDQVLALMPDHAVSHVHKGQALLLSGRYREGWSEYEWRWRLPAQISVRQDLPTPMWDGAPLAGRRLLLYAEQGFGDTLQFIRFVAAAAARGGTVILDVPPALESLVRDLPGVAQVSRQDQPAPPHDLRLALMSLPRVLGISLDTLPSDVPYLRSSGGGTWDDLLAPLAGRKVGLAWRAFAERRASALRSARLVDLAPLLALPGISWISLQKDVAAEDLPLPPNLTDPSALFTDFAATAALIDRLDLVVTVDTAVAHLAGALGKPVWVMVPKGGDWRWLTGRTDSPWYPTARLFRQPRPGDWAAVAADLATALGRTG